MPTHTRSRRGSYVLVNFITAFDIVPLRYIQETKHSLQNTSLRFTSKARSIQSPYFNCPLSLSLLHLCPLIMFFQKFVEQHFIFQFGTLQPFRLLRISDQLIFSSQWQLLYLFVSSSWILLQIDLSSFTKHYPILHPFASFNLSSLPPNFRPTLLHSTGPAEVSLLLINQERGTTHVEKPVHKAFHSVNHKYSGILFYSTYFFLV